MGNMRTILCTGLMLVGFVGGCASTPPRKEPPAPPKIEIPPAPPRVQRPVTPDLQNAAKAELLAAAQSPDASIRMHAMEGIRESMGSGGRDALLAGLKDSDPAVRFAAAMAAGELRLSAAKPQLYPMLTDKDSHIQVAAAFSLHRLGDVRYSVGLEDALNSPDPLVRADAAFALGRLGEKSAVKILRPLLRDRAVEVRLQVAEAMWRLTEDDEALRFLVAGGLSGHPAHAMVATLALAGPRDARVIQHVRAGLESDYLEVVLVTSRALGMLGSDEGYVVAQNACKATDARQRYLAALALGAIARPDAQDDLAPLLKDPEPDVRVAAATAILQLY